MYLEFYGLTEWPFSLTSNPRFIYNSRAFLQAWTDVVRAVDERQGLIVITGETGVGKSMLCRALIERLGADTYLSAIANPRVSGVDFLAQVLADFGVADVSEVPSGVHGVILIDEAQYLSLSAFEQIWKLTNLKTETGKRLQILLVGPLDLHSRLDQVVLRTLKQRVSCWAALSPLEPDEVGPYIVSRLAVARGERAEAPGTDVEFTPPALDAIAAASQGNPRLVNVIAHRALEIGHERGARSIDRQTARAAIAGAGVDAGSRSRSVFARWAPGAIVAIVAAVIVGAALWWRPGVRRAPPEPSEAVTAQPTPVAVPPSASSPGSRASPPEASPGSESTLAAADSVLVSVGPFKDAERAGAVARELAGGGLPAFTHADAAGTSHSVLVGPYVSREEALEAGRQAAALGYPDGRIVVEPR
jgi:general secretion pathway protein A